MPHLKKFVRFIHGTENATLFLLFLLLVGLAFSQVLLRNFFDTAIIWADVAIRILVLWITIFGAMVATRQHRHIRIDLVPNWLSGRARDFVRSLYLLIASIVAFVVAFYSFEIIQLEWQYPVMAFASIPTWMTQSIIPLGFLVIGLRFFIQGLCALYDGVRAAK